MSFPGIPVLANLFGGLPTQLPVLLVWAVGIVLAVAHWRRHPRVSALLVAGLAIYMVATLLVAFLNATTPWFAARRPTAHVGLLLGIASVGRSFIGAVAWGLALAAVFVDRNEGERG